MTKAEKKTMELMETLVELVSRKSRIDIFTYDKPYKNVVDEPFKFKLDSVSVNLYDLPTSMLGIKIDYKPKDPVFGLELIPVNKIYKIVEYKDESDCDGEVAYVNMRSDLTNESK